MHDAWPTCLWLAALTMLPRSDAISGTNVATTSAAPVVCVHEAENGHLLTVIIHAGC